MGAGHIAVNILYWMCAFNFRPKSMLLAVAVSTSFFGHTIPLVNFGFFSENQSPDFWDFLT